MKRLEEHDRDLEADAEALTALTNEALEKKSRYVDKHRRRLTRDAAHAVEEAVAHYRSLVDQVERAREEAVSARMTELWARLYPGEVAGASPHWSAAAGGRQRETKAAGFSAEVELRNLLGLLRSDAEWLPVAATIEQRGALQGRDPRAPEDTYWVDSDEGREWEQGMERANQERIAAAREARTEWEPD